MYIFIYIPPAKSVQVTKLETEKMTLQVRQ